MGNFPPPVVPLLGEVGAALKGIVTPADAARLLASVGVGKANVALMVLAAAAAAALSVANTE